MRPIFTILVITICISACQAYRPVSSEGYASNNADTLITQSLFTDRSSTISEENIQRVLSGTYKLPPQLRVAVVKLESPQARRYYWKYASDEDYLKTQQSYLDSFTMQFTRSPRVSKVSVIPELLISKSPSFTNIREVAVRMQADVVVIYSITGDIYSKYKLFAKPDIKAFATTQMIMMDVRTGLVPFSTIVTKDFLSSRAKGELNNTEAEKAIQHEAVLLTINEIGGQVSRLLQTQ